MAWARYPLYRTDPRHNCQFGPPAQSKNAQGSRLSHEPAAPPIIRMDSDHFRDHETLDPSPGC